jgi:DNA polymerase III subunit beta
MKVTILKENLQLATQLAGKFASQKVQLPILSQILITVEAGELYFSATDLEKGLRMRVGGRVEEVGEVAVSAKILGELVAALPLGTVTLEMVDGVLHVSAGSMKSQLQVMKADEFPAIEPEGEGEHLGEFEVSELAEIVEKVGFAVSTDASRPVLTGMYWEVKRGRVVATDGYRLSILDKVLEGGYEGGLLLPGSVVDELMRVAKETGGERFGVWYFADQGQVVFRVGEVLLTGRLIEGEYPNYEAIVPKGFSMSAMVMREELEKAVRAAAIFARDNAHVVKMKFEANSLVVSANASQLGGNETRLELQETVEGEYVIAFNAKYLIDLLTHTKSERVGISLNESLKPGKFAVEGNTQFAHVIMPVRVRD